MAELLPHEIEQRERIIQSMSAMIEQMKAEITSLGRERDSCRSALAKCREETVAECAKAKRLRTTNVRLRKQLKSAKGVSIYDT